MSVKKKIMYLVGGKADLALALFLSVVLFPGFLSAGDGLIARWTFEEGSGNTVRDVSGNNHDGRIHGAVYVPHGDGFALDFDGSGSHVNFGDKPDFRLGGEFTLELWMKPDLDIDDHHNRTVLGKILSDYAITYNPLTGAAYFFVARGNARGGLNRGHWNHVAGVFKESEARIYVNGKEAWNRRRRNIRESARTDGSAFVIGGTPGRDSTFRGLVAEAAVYGRALSAEEVYQKYRKSNLTGYPDVAFAYATPMELICADVNTHPLGSLPEGASLRVALLKEGRIIEQKRIEGIREDFTYPVEFCTKKLEDGRYSVSVSAAGPDGKSTGRSREEEVLVERDKRFPRKTARGVRLNNLVTELVNVSGSAASDGSFEFEREGKGWTFFSLEAALSGRDAVEVFLLCPDGKKENLISAKAGEDPPPWRGEAGVWEAMRKLPAGRYGLEVRGNGSPGINRLLAREIPEIMWNSIGVAAHTREDRSAEYYAGIGLRHSTSILNEPRKQVLPENRQLVEEWQAHGREVHINARLPHPTPNWPEEKMNRDDILELWLGYHVDGLDGILLDEAHWRTQYVPVYTEAANEYHRRTGQSVGIYTGDVFRYTAWAPFFREALGTGGNLYWERYLEDAPTTLSSWLKARKHFAANNMGGWRSAMSSWEPDMVPRTVLKMGTMLIPHRLNLNHWPQTDWNVYFDLLMNTVANDPVFEGIGGVSTWKTDYWEEEGVIWLGRLYRHYFIEGRRDMLSDTPLMLSHIKNPGFEAGLDFWDVSGSVRYGSFHGFGALQGHYPYTSTGDDLAVFRRSASRPNRISQKITGLEPGRLYAATIIAADFKDISRREDHAVSLIVDGAAEVGEYNYRNTFTNETRTSLNHPDRRSAWMTYVRKVFRAEGEESLLTVSDWREKGRPGGPEGQELMVGFVEVRPYRQED